MLRTKLFTAALVAALAMPALAWSTPENRAQREADRQAIFAEADANHDGALSPEEFTTFHQLMRQRFAAKPTCCGRKSTAFSPISARRNTVRHSGKRLADLVRRAPG